MQSTNQTNNLNQVKEEFIDRLIVALNFENERIENRFCDNNEILDVPYIVSVIDQQLEKCTSFLEDISIHSYEINGYVKDNTGYTYGKIRILIEKPLLEITEEEREFFTNLYEDYCYYIEFSYDERHWGYCECSSSDIGYNKEYGCCGNGCDWIAPAFTLTKEFNLGLYTWNGIERDYWSYKESFNKNEKNKQENLIKLQNEKRKQSLMQRIRELQDELNNLDNNLA